MINININTPILPWTCICGKENHNKLSDEYFACLGCELEFENNNSAINSDVIAIFNEHLDRCYRCSEITNEFLVCKKCQEEENENN